MSVDRTRCASVLGFGGCWILVGFRRYLDAGERYERNAGYLRGTAVSGERGRGVAANADAITRPRFEFLCRQSHNILTPAILSSNGGQLSEDSRIPQRVQARSNPRPTQHGAKR